MARVSTKENKNVYHIAREEHGYSREKAAELTGLEPFKIERIENEKIVPGPADVLSILLLSVTQKSELRLKLAFL